MWGALVRLGLEALAPQSARFECDKREWESRGVSRPQCNPGDASLRGRLCAY